MKGGLSTSKWWDDDDIRELVMSTGDIVTELSTSSIVEDDLNGVFNSLEPLEDPKDDMFFFGGKDLLQKIREKNPANTSVNVHRSNAANKPMPPPPSFAASHRNGNGNSGFSRTMVPTATCDPQPPLAPLAHPAKPYTYTSPSTTNDTKPLSAAAIASATASAMYLDNYLAASGSQNKYPNTVTTAPPPLLPTVLDKPTKTPPSILRRPAHRSAPRSVLSKSHPAYSSFNPLTTSNDPKLNDSNPLKSSTGATDSPVSALHNPVASSPSSMPPHIPAGYAAGPVAHKRGRSSHAKNSNELKQGRVIYNPTMANNADYPNNANNSTLHHSSEIAHPTALLNNNLSASQSDSNLLATSGSITRNVVTPEIGENESNKTNNYYTPNPNVPNNYKMENLNSHRVTANVDYMNYSNFNHFFPYPGGIPVHNFYVPPAPNDAPVPVPVPEPGYRMEPQTGYDPTSESSHPTPNPSNDLYSNLYLYSFNNMYNNNNNNNNSYSRTTPPPVPDMNSLYNYNNLYLNSLYGYPAYPARQYPPGYHMATSAYEAQAYRSSENFDEDFDEDEDYRSERHTRSYSKRSKRRPEDDEYRKPSRKSKNKSKKRNKHQNYEETSRHESTENSGTHTTTDIPKTENLSPAVFTPPLSPAHSTRRTKANLFENTPKIKIGDVPSGNAKMSKLGRKLLEVMNLDWRTPYLPGERSVSTPILKSPTGTGTPNADEETSQKSNCNTEVFAEYDNAPERKTELLYFVANNVEALLTMPTKIEATLNDFKASALGAKIKQRLQVMTTIKQAKELGLILEGQYEIKQKQYLDAFTFGMNTSEKKVTE